MDYEQKYKNALEWARGIYPNAVGADREDLEHYFPELAESEDERIRNDLKRAISVALDYSYLDEECADKCLAWLEKQGEQKHTWSEEDERLRKTTIAFLKDFAEKGYENAVECIDWIESLKERLGGEK